MASSVFVFDLLVAFVAAAFLLWRYSDMMRQRVLVTLTVLIAWYFSLLIIFVIPLDVSSTIYSACSNASEPSTEVVPTVLNTTTTTVSTSTTTTERLMTSPSTPATPPGHSVSQRSAPGPACPPPASLLPDGVLLGLWRVVYWTSQLLTWIVLPLMQSFTQAGEFTFLGKLRSSLWDNAIYYTSYLFIALVLVIYIALQPDLHLTWGRTKAIAAAASNTWGLCLLVLMLGYGLVEVPRTLWNSSKRGHSLSLAYFKVSKLWGERSDAEGRLEEVVGSLEAAAGGEEGAPGLAGRLAAVLGKVPPELRERMRRRQGRPGGEAGVMQEAALARLHKQLVVALTAHRRTEAQWTQLMETVYWLEDNQRNLSSQERRFKRQTEAPDRGWLGFIINPMTEWYCRCLVLPWLQRCLAAAALLLSLILTWSEVTFFSKQPTLSLMAIFVEAGAADRNYRAVELVSFVAICYMCICAYYTIFQVRVLNYYYLAPNHQSDEYTLLFSGALLCRLTPPLCLNFLSLVHLDSHVITTWDQETAYTRVMGHMDVVSIVKDVFNIYFPILLLLLTLATYFSLGSRLLSLLGFQQFLEQAELTGELVEEGRELVGREKRRRERLTESARHRRDFRPDEFTDSAPGGSEARQRAAAAVAAGREDSSLQTERPPSRYSGSPEAAELGRPAGRGPPRNLFDGI